MPDQYTARVSVTLAAGAAATPFAHGIIVRGTATAPQYVMADRMTSIMVNTVDATNINCSNPGSAAATAVFLVQFLHSIQATPAMTAPGIFWQGGSGGGVGSQSPFSNDYYVQPAVTADAGARLYPTVAAALAAADLALAAGVTVVLNIHTIEGVLLTYDGTSIPTGRSVTFVGDGGRTQTAITIEGVWAAALSEVDIIFRNCDVAIGAAALTLGTFRNLIFDNSDCDCNGRLVTMAASRTFTFSDGTLVDPRFIGLGAGISAVSLNRMVLTSDVADVTPTLFSNVVAFTALSSQISVIESGWTFVSQAVIIAGGFSATQWTSDNTGAGAATIFSAPTVALDIEDFVMSSIDSSGGGTVNLGMTTGSGGSLRSGRVRTLVNGATSLLQTDGTILADATAGTVALTLPDANIVPNGTSIVVQRINAFAAGGNDVTIAVIGTNTINGVAGPYSFNALVLDRPAVTLISSQTGTGAWFVAGVAGRATSTDSTAAPGNATAQTANGQAAFAAGAATVVITNAYVTATSRVLCQYNGTVAAGVADVTLTSITIVDANAGSFTVTGNAVATAATAFSWVVLPG